MRMIVADDDVSFFPNKTKQNRDITKKKTSSKQKKIEQRQKTAVTLKKQTYKHGKKTKRI